MNPRCSLQKFLSVFVGLLLFSSLTLAQKNPRLAEVNPLSVNQQALLEFVSEQSGLRVVFGDESV